jgi:hypothetical protein
MRRDVGEDLTAWGAERKLFGWVAVSVPAEVGIPFFYFVCYFIHHLVGIPASYASKSFGFHLPRLSSPV